MSTPPEQKKLWKNIDWKDEEEKLAFFNHYFKNSSMVNDRINSQVKQFTDGILGFIEEGKIKLNDNKTRPITVQDIVAEIKKRS